MNVRMARFDLYNCDVSEVAEVVLGHIKGKRIQGKCVLNVFLYCVAVELDMPWNSDQVSDYGSSFEAWGENEIKMIIKLLATNLVVTPWAFVVSYISGVM